MLALLTFNAGWQYLLGALAILLLVIGADDLIPVLICLLRGNKGRSSAAGPEQPLPERRIAIFVPCWRESDVIRNMIRHNLAAVRYRNFEVFVGAYPNDGPTLAAVRELTAEFSNVHLAECPHPGPTSKADCLNSIYARMEEFERERGVYFDTLLLHDAEDLIHPQALAVINRERERFAMVQVPVLPLPTGFADITHGVYCDEFAEYQMVDMRARCLAERLCLQTALGLDSRGKCWSVWRRSIAAASLIRPC